MAREGEGTAGAADAHAGASGQGAAAQGTAGAAGYVSEAKEGSIKQATDINTEEALSILQSLAAKGGVNLSDLQAVLATLNAKRTHDQSQSVDLLTLTGDMNHRQNLNQLTVQALQNAVETHNMVAKQAIRHSDLNVDAQLNPIQQGAADTLTLRAVSLDDASLKALATTMAAAVAGVINK